VLRGLLNTIPISVLIVVSVAIALVALLASGRAGMSVLERLMVRRPRPPAT